MFEQKDATVERDKRSRLIMLVSGGAALIVIALIVFVTSQGSKISSVELEISTSGSSEFDSYSHFVSLITTPEDRTTAKNLLGNNVAMLRAKVHNTGDRSLVALQLRAVAVGLSNEVLAEKIVTPIPRVTESLGPNEFLRVEIQLDRIPDPSEIADMRIELYGLKLK